MHEQGKSSDVIAIIAGAILCVVATTATKALNQEDTFRSNIIFTFGYVPTFLLAILALALAVSRKFFFKKELVTKSAYAYIFIGNSKIIYNACSLIEISVTFLFGWMFAFVTIIIAK